MDRSHTVASPVSEMGTVFHRYQRLIQSFILRFILGFIISVPFTFLFFLWGVRNFASNYRQIWLIAFLFSLFGIGLLSAQLLLLHERAHHTVYPSAEWLPKMRYTLITLGFTLAAFPLLVFLPTSSTSEFLSHQAVSIYSRASAFFVTLSMPYLSKIVWDYLPLRKKVAARLPYVTALAFGGVALVAIVINIWAGVYQPPLSKIVTKTIFAVLIAAGFTFSLTWGMSGFREGHSYAEDLNVHGQHFDYFEKFRLNKKLPVVFGLLTGFGLPLLAGAQRAISLGIEIGIIDATVLVVGYFVALVAVAGLIISSVFFALLLGVFLLLGNYLMTLKSNSE